MLFDVFGDKIIIFDGAMGTMLSPYLKAGEAPETLNISAPDAVISVYEKYISAGADVISTNTFGANGIKLACSGIDAYETVFASVSLARKAADSADRKILVAADFGPTGKLLEPLGELTFEEAVNAYAKPLEAAEKAGADFIFFETFSDLYEAKAAFLSARENTSLPVAVSLTYDESGRTLTGADAETAATYLGSLGVDAISVNCGLGPDKMLPVAKILAKNSKVPVIVNANAGLPKIVGGKTVYDVTPEIFASYVKELADSGVRCIGGCCGTTPEHIKAVAAEAKKYKFAPKYEKGGVAVCSGRRKYIFGESVAVVGERLNPTGKPKLKEALRSGDLDHLRREAVSQQTAGADILDVNVGLPEIDEKEMLYKASRAVQSVTDLPLQLDSSDPAALEKAARVYDGIPVINSVSGKKEVLDTVLPIIKKYGAVAVALLLDESGIPDLPDDRLKIADKIIKEAEKYGIEKERFLFDALTMTVATDKKSGDKTLECVEKLTNRGLYTTLGVSNISYGMPNRAQINAMFLGAAIDKGLTAAIIDPNSESAKTVISDASAREPFDVDKISPEERLEIKKDGSMTLFDSVFFGLPKEAKELTQKALENKKPLEIIEKDLIPALNALGDGYEKKTLFLPRLLGGADAAKAAFAVVNSALSGEKREKHEKVVIATVHGDIHDIGKNIVATLLDNYGFEVIDLGKDVPEEKIVEETLKSGARIVGLSALMTTTVPAMEKTVKLLRESVPDCKIMVGGAVLTKEYAENMGADFYGEDAISDVRYALSLEK